MIRSTATAALVTLGAIVTSSLVAGTIATASATPAAHAGPLPTFTFTSQLEVSLLTARRLTRITGSSNPMRVVATSAELTEDDGDFAPAGCVGAFEPGHLSAYAAAAPTGVATQLVADGKPARALHFVNQTVLGVADAEAASGQLRSSARAWSRCSGQTVTYTRRSGEVRQWRLEATELRRDGTVLVQKQIGDAVSCERAMTAAAAEGSAIIVDVVACDLRGEDPWGQAEQIATAIAANVNRSG